MVGYYYGFNVCTFLTSCDESCVHLATGLTLSAGQVLNKTLQTFFGNAEVLKEIKIEDDESETKSFGACSTACCKCRYRSCVFSHQLLKVNLFWQTS